MDKSKIWGKLVRWMILFLHMCGYMVCKCSHVYVCMFICASAWVYVHMCEYVCDVPVCIHAHMCVCMCIPCICICFPVQLYGMLVNIYERECAYGVHFCVFIHMCEWVCAHVCMYECVWYIHVHVCECGMCACSYMWICVWVYACSYVGVSLCVCMYTYSPWPFIILFTKIYSLTLLCTCWVNICITS